MVCMVADIADLIFDRMEETQAWWKQLRPHVAKVYMDTEHNQITQIPLFISLLTQAGYDPGDPLFQDLQQGFSTIGDLHRRGHISSFEQSTR